jgi:hypothetical protein
MLSWQNKLKYAVPFDKIYAWEHVSRVLVKTIASFPGAE